MDKIRIVPSEDLPYVKYILLAGMGVSGLLALYFWIMFIFSGLSPLLNGVLVTGIILIVLLIVFVVKLYPEFILNNQTLTIKRAFRYAVEYQLKEIRKEIIIIEKPSSYHVVFSSLLDQKIKVKLTREHIKVLEQMGFVLVSIGVKYN